MALCGLGLLAHSHLYSHRRSEEWVNELSLALALSPTFCFPFYHLHAVMPLVTVNIKSKQKDIWICSSGESFQNVLYCDSYSPRKTLPLFCSPSLFSLSIALLFHDASVLCSVHELNFSSHVSWPTRQCIYGIYAKRCLTFWMQSRMCSLMIDNLWLRKG